MKRFVPKFIKLNKEEVNIRINWLNEKLPFLTEEEADSVRYWNDPRSPYGGTVIDETSDHRCYPYDKDKIEFKKEFPDGEVFELNLFPIKLSELIEDPKSLKRVKTLMEINRHTALVYRHFDGRMLVWIGFYPMTSSNFNIWDTPIDTVGDIDSLKKEAEKYHLDMLKGYGDSKGHWLTLMARRSDITGWEPMEEIGKFS